MTGITTLFEIPELLHDAPLVSGDWDSNASRLTLVYECLRRNLDGREIEDRRVSIVLDDVAAVAVAYDSWRSQVRPSELVVPERAVVTTLAPWPFQETEALLAINSRFDAEDVELFARCDWLCGGRSAGNKTRYQLGLRFLGRIPDVQLLLWVGAGSITPAAGTGPLSLELWAGQYRAWWDHWNDHWEEEGVDDDEEVEEGDEEHRLDLEDTAIPAGEELPPDLSYRPPNEPAFELSATDAPAEIVTTLRDWFESLVDRDWARRAAAEPNIDLDPEEQVSAITERFLGDEFGRWGYARAIDQWWVEGKRAYIRIRGIEHAMPDEDDPAENVESVWDLPLRRRGGKWQICGPTQQGWPCYGSAEEKPSREKPWLEGWQGGEVKTSRV